MIDRNSSILITGGTGSFGQAMVRKLLERLPDIRRLVIFSRDELKQYEMAQQFSPSDYSGLRYFIGDVRDADRLRRALDGIDIVIHAAALKHVPAAEYNPFEAIKTNVIGAQNVVECALDNGIRKVIALSTDKAAAPVNLYGATKLCSDKLFIAANRIRGNRDIAFSVVRYGNVMGSRGSVIPFFLKSRETGTLPITDPEMTRFSITLDQSVDFVLRSVETAIGGEMLVPRIPSYRLRDLASAIGPDCRQEIVGIRPGEKLHEDLITKSDGTSTLEFDDHFAILPSGAGEDLQRWNRDGSGQPVADGFTYSSDQNTDFMTVEALRTQIEQQFGVPLG